MGSSSQVLWLPATSAIKNVTRMPLITSDFHMPRAMMVFESVLENTKIQFVRHAVPSYPSSTPIFTCKEKDLELLTNSSVKS
mmetsp:Transcript_21536/g.32061  ORF Transcript_21536/g.32061 Transcript_21536/m.32061 type:complete len:82 (+) Transcript_21536:1137-1382(+)